LVAAITPTLPEAIAKCTGHGIGSCATSTALAQALGAGGRVGLRMRGVERRGIVGVEAMHHVGQTVNGRSAMVAGEQIDRHRTAVDVEQTAAGFDRLGGEHQGIAVAWQHALLDVSFGEAGVDLARNLRQRARREHPFAVLQMPGEAVDLLQRHVIDARPGIGLGDHR
jgi:hypothetical protein